MHPIHQARAIALLCCPAALASCGSDAESDLTSPATAPGPQLQATGTQQQITGSAFITLAEQGDAQQRMTFSAVRHHDGEVTGQFEIFSSQEGGIRIHGRITCLGIQSSDGELVGHLGLVITQPTIPEWVGINGAWTVVDLGEGGAAEPDLTSDIIFASPEEVEAFCDFAFGLDIIPSERGNIQIHP